METQSILNIVGLVSSIASFIVAVGAIWLAIVFYRLSTDASKCTHEAAKGIDASVARLEKLFDKLYTDTFSMMRDTVSDMRKHIWPPDTTEEDPAMAAAERKADEKIATLQASIKRELSSILQRQSLTDEKIVKFKDEFSHLINNAIESSRQVESQAREEALRDTILSTVQILEARKDQVLIDEVVSRIRDSFPMKRILIELAKLRMENRLEFNPDILGAETIIRIKKKEREQ
jgi:hypothetical protein